MKNSEKKRKNVDRVVKEEVAHFLIENPDYTGDDLKKKVEKALKLKKLHYNFTERTYQSLKSKMDLNSNNPLDKPWSIGACNKANIPASIIPLLLREVESIGNFKIFNDPAKDDQWTDNYKKQRMLTIRQAQWFAKLEPLILPKAKELYPDNEQRQYACLIIYGKRYAEREKIAEIMGESYPYTADLDKLDLSPDELSKLF